MTITCVEKYDSREVTDGQSAELTYAIRGTADEGEAIDILKSTAPTSFRGLVRQPVTVEPVHQDTYNSDDSIWNGTAKYTPYEPPEIPETGESSYSFDTSGGSQHITQSLETVASYAISGIAPDFKGAIRATHDNVEGVDITVPVYNFSETHYVSNDDLNKSAYFYLTGRVNDASFKGFDAGECLFLGASGSKRGKKNDWEITFKFAASPNRTNITVGDITEISKKGWEYMWPRYADSEDDTAKAIVKKPVAVYIEKVYEYGDLGDLGI